MPTETIENYLKAIHTLVHESPTSEATVVRLAAVLGVTKGTVTSMVHKLRRAGLARAERYGGITLTPKGSRLALDVIRRHRLIEVFLVQVLKFDWSEVHDEAERLEHAMSPRLLDRLDAFLGRPAIDPHGDPIPDANGRLPAFAGAPLSTFRAGERGVIARVSDQDPAFLSFAAGHGLKPGTRLRVLEAIPAAESMRVKSGRSAPVTLSLAAAQKIVVTRGGGPGDGAIRRAKRADRG